jgi:hypothetical protein
LDLETRTVVASFDVGSDPDVLAYDARIHRMYVAGEAGVVSVFNAEAGVVTIRAEALVGANEHVVGVAPGTHQVFFPLRNVGGPTMLRIMAPTPWCPRPNTPRSDRHACSFPDEFVDS